MVRQAAWTAIRCNERIKTRWLSLSRKGNKKSAAVAIARQLLVALWQMARRNEPYRAPAEQVAAA